MSNEINFLAIEVLGTAPKFRKRKKMLLCVLKPSTKSWITNFHVEVVEGGKGNGVILRFCETAHLPLRYDIHMIKKVLALNVTNIHCKSSDVYDMKVCDRKERLLDYTCH